MEVPGVVRSVKAPEGGADMESTMRSCGDTVCRLGVCGGAGSLMGSNWDPKLREPSKRPSPDSGAEVKSLKSNMSSDGTSERVGFSFGSGCEELSGKEIPSKSWERDMLAISC